MSDLIRQAVAVTRWRWPEVPTKGMVTFVDEEKTVDGRSRWHPPGWCYRRAGFREVGRTKQAGLVALQLEAQGMPPPAAPIGAQASLFIGGAL